MDKNPNIFRKLINGGDISFDKELDPCNTPVGSSRFQLGTNSGTSGTDSDEYVRDPGSILSLQPWIFKREKQNPNMNPNFSEKAETSSGYKSSLRTRRGHRNLIKPISISIENCLIPQLYNEDFKFEEHVFGSVKTRPFIVTDGIRVISKNPNLNDCLREKKLKEVRKGKRKSFDLDENGNLRSSKLSNSQAHSPSYPAEERSNKNNKNNNNNNKIFLLSIGICIGVLSSILSNKKELEKLSDKLKRTENLVQDLQDELEMKDSLTVQELLPVEEQEPSRSFLQDEGKSQPMSKIEAELEAELEMLELNITSSSIQGRTGEDEVDEELLGEIVRGELKAETLNKREDYDDDDDDNNYDDDISNSNHWTGPVSPRQLSIRLHEVLQQRLEERINELETALALSEKEIQLLETTEPSVFSEKTLSNSDLDSGPLNNEPFCLNLSGDALNAYQEAFEEFNRINGEDDLKEGENEKVYNYNINDYNYDSHVDDDSDDDCDEIIQKIMEKTRQGSPVVRHAQMMLLNLDDLTLID